MTRVLLIEDDAEVRRLAGKLLVGCGYQVLEAENGTKGAGGVARTHQPDIVIIGVASPDADGYEVMLQLRGITSPKNPPIVAMGDPKDRETALSLGADGFIAQPIVSDSFVAAVQRYLTGFRELRVDCENIPNPSRLRETVRKLECKLPELFEAKEQLEEMARLRREFLRNFSHEFATPMTPVVGYLRLLLDEEMGPLTPLQRKCLESIDNSTQKLRALIDTLLDVSALEMGRLHLYERQYDFGVVVDKAVNETKLLFAEAGISLVREQGSQDPLPARGDSDKLRRAIMHILDNAAKFTSRGGEVGVAIRTVPGNRGEGAEYQLIVVDDGPGISKEDSKKIMEWFYQVDGSPTRAHGGVGLGLAFASRVAEGMGGSVEVHSPPEVMVAGRSFRGTSVVLSVKRSPKMGDTPDRIT